MCPKAEAFALSILRDAEASFWDKAEAESYLESEAIRPVLWLPCLYFTGSWVG